MRDGNEGPSGAVRLQQRCSFKGQSQKLGLVHVLKGSGRAVNFSSQANINAEIAPGVLPGITDVVVDQPPDGILQGVGIAVVKLKRVAEQGDEHIPGPGGAIVEEIVVVVIPVLGQAVDFQKLVHRLLLDRRQVQYLLVHSPIEIGVLVQKPRKVSGAELVKQVAFGEVAVEIRLVKIKHSVVVGNVDPRGLVCHPDGTVPEGLK